MSNRASSSADSLQLASFRQENADPETVGGDAEATIRRRTREFPVSGHLELGRDGSCTLAGARRLAELRKA